jgi:hypothetical protein
MPPPFDRINLAGSPHLEKSPTWPTIHLAGIAVVDFAMI